jgi:hypothetical protein
MVSSFNNKQKLTNNRFSVAYESLIGYIAMHLSGESNAGLLPLTWNQQIVT